LVFLATLYARQVRKFLHSDCIICIIGYQILFRPLTKSTLRRTRVTRFREARGIQTRGDNLSLESNWRCRHEWCRLFPSPRRRGRGASRCQSWWLVADLMGI